MRYALLLTLTAMACQTSDATLRGSADSLRSVLTDTVRADTAALRRAAEIEKCVYVYVTDERIRECLVMKHGWPPQEAAREIAVYLARMQRQVDSLKHVRDSIVAAARAKEQERFAAEQRRRDSIYLARDRLDGPSVPAVSTEGPWLLDERTGGYYRTTCAAARRIPVRARVYFRSEDHIKAAEGAWPSRQPGCQVRRDLLDGPPVAIPDTHIHGYVADPRTGAYYAWLSTCEAAKRIPVEVRLYYRYLSEVMAEGFWPSRQPGC